MGAANPAVNRWVDKPKVWGDYSQSIGMKTNSFIRSTTALQLLLAFGYLAATGPRWLDP
jgi:hypothetical protein